MTFGTLTVNYSVLNSSTAASGTNFTALTGQASFAAGSATAYTDFTYSGGTSLSAIR